MNSKWYIPARSAELPFTVNVTPESAGWSESSLQVLEIGEHWMSNHFELHTGHTEVMILPLTGGGTVECGGEFFELSPRSSVFDGPADMVYLGIGQEYRLSGEGRFAICGARATRSFRTAGAPPPTYPWSFAVRATAAARCTTSALQQHSRPTR